MFHLLDDVRVWSTEQARESSADVGTREGARNLSPLARGGWRRREEGAGPLDGPKA